MAWLDKRKSSDGTSRYRLRDKIDGKSVTIIKNLGIWKAHANTWKENYEKARAQGFTWNVLPVTVEIVEAFLKAKERGEDSPHQGRRIPIEQFCDLYVKHHGPSLKGGVDMSWNKPYRNLIWKMSIVKRRWAGKYSDEINPHDVRDFLAVDKTVGSRMKYLGMLGHMFKSFAEWNEEGTILSFPVKIPARNPAAAWRSKMKPNEKKELPDTRVLSPEEWDHFKKHLTPRAFAICDLTLRRFLRMADIRTLAERSHQNGYLTGRQEKTGDRYSVPALANQPRRYDFTNFKREFLQAQIAAGMDYPAEHPLHFSVKDLRRTGATWAYRKTKDLVGVSEMLGHTNTRTTKRYLNITESDKLQIAAAVDQLFAPDQKDPPAAGTAAVS